MAHSDTKTQSAPTLSKEYQSFAEGVRLLAVASQEGDTKKHQELLIAITPSIRSLVQRKWWGDNFSHEDIVQDILLIVHTKLHTYNPSMPIMPWLHTIAHYRILDCVRHFKRKESLHDPIDSDEDVTFPEEGSNSDIERLEDADFIAEALKSLPQKQAQVVYMLKIQGLSLDEVASKIGMSVSAVKVTAHRAYKALAKFTDKQLGEFSK